MDALQLLHADHDRLSRIFAQLETAVSERDLIRCFREVRSTFLNHTETEENVFYPPFARYDELAPLIDSLRRDHQMAKTLLQQFESQLRQREDTADVMSRFINSVRDHLQREETELFPIVRKMMKRHERENLGRHMLGAVQEKAA